MASDGEKCDIGTPIGGEKTSRRLSPLNEMDGDMPSHPHDQPPSMPAYPQLPMPQTVLTVAARTDAMEDVLDAVRQRLSSRMDKIDTRLQQVEVEFNGLLLMKFLFKFDSEDGERTSFVSPDLPIQERVPRSLSEEAPSLSPTENLPDPHKEYRIVAKHSGKVLAIASAGMVDDARITQWSYKGRANQHFKLVGAGRYYQIMALHSHKFLCAPPRNRCNRARIYQYSNVGNDSQLFDLRLAGDGQHYYIIAKHSGKAVSVRALDGKTDGATVWQWSLHRSSNQQFRFEEVSSEISCECP